MQICKHAYYGKCANPDCPMMEGRCPVPSTPGVCRYEEFQTEELVNTEYTETISVEFTKIHKLTTTPKHDAHYELSLRADPTEWIKALLGADDVKVISHKIFKKG